MHIFIDESGSFIQPTDKKNLVSCVAALIIPDKFLSSVEKDFSELKIRWGVNPGEEIKGNKVNEAQANELIQLLIKHEVFLYAECIDMGLHEQKEIENHKEEQSQNFNSAAELAKHETYRHQLLEHAENTRKQSNQQYVQSCILMRLCEHVIRKSTLYFSQFLPEELGNFKWILDSKGGSFERIWSISVLPGLQSVFLKEPLMACIDYDYSHYDDAYRFKGDIPDYLKSHVKAGAGKAPTDLRRLIMGNLTFTDSKANLGLQIIDILSSIISRSCNNKLQKEGWESIGMLFLQAEKGSHPLGMSMLSNSMKSGSIPYNDVFKSIYSKARSPFKA